MINRAMKMEGIYKGKPCIMQPTIVKYRNTEKINHIIGTAIAGFIERHIEVGKDVKLFNISPRFEEVNINDFNAYFEYQTPFIIDGIAYYIKEQAFEAFKEVFRKLIVNFEYEALHTNDETVNKLKNGYWLNRAKHNDHLWAECSECGFRVENYKAVETGVSSDDYVGVKYNYCPKCGSKMIVELE